jgi:hypothetical protein
MTHKKTRKSRVINGSKNQALCISLCVCVTENIFLTMAHKKTRKWRVMEAQKAAPLLGRNDKNLKTKSVHPGKKSGDFSSEKKRKRKSL